MTASRNDQYQTNLALASKGPSTHDSTFAERNDTNLNLISGTASDLVH